MGMNKYINVVDVEGKLKDSSTSVADDTQLSTQTSGYAVITVTVASGKFVLDGVSQATAQLARTGRVKFDQSDSSNGSHPLRLSETSDGTHGGGSIYTGASDSDGTTKVTASGTPGSAGAYTFVKLNQAVPSALYYYCTNHSGMGGALAVDSVTSAITQLSDGKVGVGTDSPSRKLDVNGDIKVRGNEILGSHASNVAISFDSSSNVTVPYNLTVSGTLNGLTYPTSDGSSGQVLTTNGSGTLSFTTVSGGSGIASVSADTDPTLGGDLKVGGYSIVSTSNGNIPITPHGSGTIVLDGLVWPTSDGSADQVLKTNGSGVLGWVTQSGGSGGGFSVSTATADVTLGDFQTAYDNASAKGFSISPSGLTIPSGKTLLGVKWELVNTLGRDSYGSFSTAYQAAAVGIDDPSGSSIMPSIIGGAWNAGSNYSQSSPYLSAQVGPAPGWYYQDSSYNSNYIQNDGTVSTSHVSAFGSCCIKVSSNTQVKVYYYENPSDSYTWKIPGSNSSSARILHKLTIFYA